MIRAPECRDSFWRQMIESQSVSLLGSTVLTHSRVTLSLERVGTPEPPGKLNRLRQTKPPKACESSLTARSGTLASPAPPPTPQAPCWSLSTAGPRALSSSITFRSTRATARALPRERSSARSTATVRPTISGSTSRSTSPPSRAPRPSTSTSRTAAPRGLAAEP